MVTDIVLQECTSSLSTRCSTCSRGGTRAKMSPGWVVSGVMSKLTGSDG